MLLQYQVDPTGITTPHASRRGLGALAGVDSGEASPHLADEFAHSAVSQCSKLPIVDCGLWIFEVTDRQIPLPVNSVSNDPVHSCGCLLAGTDPDDALPVKSI